MDETPPPTKISPIQGEQTLTEGLAQQPQVSTSTPSLAPNEPLSSHHGSPQPMSATPPQTQFIQAQTQPMGMGMGMPLGAEPFRNKAKKEKFNAKKEKFSNYSIEGFEGCEYQGV